MWIPKMKSPSPEGLNAALPNEIPQFMLLSGHSANDLYLSMFKQKVRLKLDIDLLDINFVKFLFRDGIISYVSKESLVEPLTLREKDKKANYTSKRYFKKPLFLYLIII